MAKPATADPSSWCALLRIGRPHGLRGELRALNLAPGALPIGTFAAGREFFLRKDGKALGRRKVKDIWSYQGEWLILLDGIEDRTASEKMNQVELCLPFAGLPKLPEGWFWEEQIAGCAVTDATLGPIGLAEGFEQVAGQSLLVLRTPAKEKVLIPWVKAWIREINTAERRIALDLPAGIPGLESASPPAPKPE